MSVYSFLCIRLREPSVSVKARKCESLGLKEIEFIGVSFSKERGDERRCFLMSYFER